MTEKNETKDHWSYHLKPGDEIQVAATKYYDGYIMKVEQLILDDSEQSVRVSIIDVDNYKSFSRFRLPLNDKVYSIVKTAVLPEVKEAPIVIKDHWSFYLKPGDEVQVAATDYHDSHVAKVVRLNLDDPILNVAMLGPSQTDKSLKVISQYSLPLDDENYSFAKTAVPPETKEVLPMTKDHWSYHLKEGDVIKFEPTQDKDYTYDSYEMTVVKSNCSAHDSFPSSVELVGYPPFSPHESTTTCSLPLNDKQCSLIETEHKVYVGGKFSGTEAKKPAEHGYHTVEIPRGVYGEWSKVVEEWNEALDAKKQDNPLMLMQELSDLLGAIGAFSEKRWNVTIDDLLKMTQATSRAFKSGHRKNRDG
jgi:hypothetical protein